MTIKTPPQVLEILEKNILGLEGHNQFTLQAEERIEASLALTRLIGPARLSLLVAHKNLLEKAGESNDSNRLEEALKKLRQLDEGQSLEMASAAVLPTMSGLLDSLNIIESAANIAFCCGDAWTFSALQYVASIYIELNLAMPPNLQDFAVGCFRGGRVPKRSQRTSKDSKFLRDGIIRASVQQIRDLGFTRDHAVEWFCDFLVKRNSGRGLSAETIKKRILRNSKRQKHAHTELKPIDIESLSDTERLQVVQLVTVIYHDLKLNERGLKD